MKTLIGALGLAAALASATATAQAAIVVHTSAFIVAPTHYNGFENLILQNLGGVTTDVEDGIAVGIVSDTANINIVGQAKVADGLKSWYAIGVDPGQPAPGGVDAFGYTRINLAEMGDIGAIQFKVSSALLAVNPLLNYQLISHATNAGGEVVAMGTLSPVSLYGSQVVGAGGPIPLFETFGFSGGGFDEVRLQVNETAGFDPFGLEAGIYDAVEIDGTLVPEPASWALMIMGFGLTGAALRHRRVAQPVRVKT